MIDLPLKLPETLIDNSTLSAMDDCERKGFFRYVRGWSNENRIVAFGFGTAWHSAMDYLWQECCGKSISWLDASKDSILTLAFAEFMLSWRDQGMPEQAELDLLPKFGLPRTPQVAKQMLATYFDKRKHFLSKVELLAVELPFVVPLFPDRDDIGYVGLIDKVIRHQDGHIIIIDHKTTTMFASASGFRMDFVESFNPSSQFTGYTWATSYIYGEPVTHAWADASLVHKDQGIIDKKGNDHHSVHKFIPNSFGTEQKQEWLEDAQVKVRRYLENLNNLENSQPCFPKSTSSCTNRGICSFQSICIGCPDWKTMPTPAGYKIEFWSPIKAIFNDLELEI